MNYTDLVNEVLIRMREDTVDSIGGSRLTITDDPVVDIVKLAINDAKRLVEDSHTWNALRHDWTFTSAAGTHTYPLTGAGNYGTIDTVYSSNGTELRNVSLSYIHKKSAQQPANNTPMYFAANGVDANGDLSIRLFNTPKASLTYTVHGFKRTPELDIDSDKLIVPSKPVIYMAFALASRERGEAGGAQAGELFIMAEQYLKDAIALDCANSDLDNDWNVR